MPKRRGARCHTHPFCMPGSAPHASRTIITGAAAAAVVLKADTHVVTHSASPASTSVYTCVPSPLSLLPMSPSAPAEHDAHDEDLTEEIGRRGRGGKDVRNGEVGRAKEKAGGWRTGLGRRRGFPGECGAETDRTHQGANVAPSSGCGEATQGAVGGPSGKPGQNVPRVLYRAIVWTAGLWRSSPPACRLRGGSLARAGAQWAMRACTRYSH
eukprot:scaffold5515_cov148-Isochrysis_galbana.AAC.1